MTNDPVQESRPDLHALVYVSTAAHRLSEAEIDLLLQKARARNEKERVTGVLLYSDGNFMQYLEGPTEGMATIYSVIKSDPLHYGIIELLREPIRAREFSDWYMAYRPFSNGGFSNETEDDKRLLDKLSPANGTSSASHMIMTKFWNKGRGQLNF